MFRLFYAHTCLVPLSTHPAEGVVTVTCQPRNSGTVFNTQNTCRTCVRCHSTGTTHCLLLLIILHAGTAFVPSLLPFAVTHHSVVCTCQTRRRTAKRTAPRLTPPSHNNELNETPTRPDQTRGSGARVCAFKSINQSSR